MRLEINKLDEIDRVILRDTIKLVLCYWPNAHLGDVPPREDIREAFRRIRRDTPRLGFHGACATLQNDALRYRDA